MGHKGKHANPYLSNIDWVLISLVIALSIIGILAVYSATLSRSDNIRSVVVQSVAFFIGVGVIFLLSVVDYDYFSLTSKYIYIINILLLVATLIWGTGMSSWGGKSWIRIGGIGIQPAEIVKIGFILTFASHLNKMKEDINRPSVVLSLLVHLGILIALIMLQPDAGTAMVFVFIFAVMLYVADIKYNYIAIAGGIIAIAVPIIFIFFLKDYQINRILVFFDPESAPAGAGYNVLQSKIAVGSGGLFGKGFLQGTQNQLGYLPTKQTDFIFAVISEEFGFLGSLIVSGLLFSVIFRCITIAKYTRDAYGKFICIGVSAMFSFHVIENIGMCVGLLPVTGIPLPFISYGGSSLLTNLVCIGIVNSVSMRSKSLSF